MFPKAIDRIGNLCFCPGKVGGGKKSMAPVEEAFCCNGCHNLSSENLPDVGSRHRQDSSPGDRSALSLSSIPSHPLRYIASISITGTRPGASLMEVQPSAEGRMIPWK